MNAHPRRGRLVTLEGGEGAGKSTVLAAVRERLESHGFEVVVAREPGGTAFGEAVHRDLEGAVHRSGRDAIHLPREEGLIGIELFDVPIIARPGGYAGGVAVAGVDGGQEGRTLADAAVEPGIDHHVSPRATCALM